MDACALNRTTFDRASAVSRRDQDRAHQEEQPRVPEPLEPFDRARHFHPASSGCRCQRHSIKETAHGCLRSVEIAVRVQPHDTVARSETGRSLLSLRCNCRKALPENCSGSRCAHASGNCPHEFKTGLHFGAPTRRSRFDVPGFSSCPCLADVPLDRNRADAPARHPCERFAGRNRKELSMSRGFHAAVIMAHRNSVWLPFLSKNIARGLACEKKLRAISASQLEKSSQPAEKVSPIFALFCLVVPPLASRHGTIPSVSILRCQAARSIDPGTAANDAAART